MTERSGKALWVHHRLACPKFLKQTFHEYADQSIRFSGWARRYYDQQRGRGNNHHAALRSLAFKLGSPTSSGGSRTMSFVTST